MLARNLPLQLGLMGTIAMLSFGIWLFVVSKEPRPKSWLYTMIGLLALSAGTLFYSQMQFSFTSVSGSTDSNETQIEVHTFNP